MLTEMVEMLFKPKTVFSKLKLYRVQSDKVSIIKPKFINSGTKLSSARFSVFLGRDKTSVTLYGLATHILFPALIGMTMTDATKADFEQYKKQVVSVYDGENSKIYISDEFPITNIKDSDCFYLYTKTFPWHVLGIGHSVNLDEFTYDKEFAPDVTEEIMFKDVKHYVHIISREDLANKSVEASTNKNSKIEGSLIYLSTYERKQRLADFVKEHNLDRKTYHL